MMLRIYINTMHTKIQYLKYVFYKNEPKESESCEDLSICKIQSIVTTTALYKFLLEEIHGRLFLEHKRLRKQWHEYFDSSCHGNKALKCLSCENQEEDNDKDQIKELEREKVRD